MAIGVTVLLMAAAPDVPPAFDLATVGQSTDAAAMVDQERAAIGLKPQPCRPTSDAEIVVCARRGPSTSPRLAMPEARFEPGEVVHHPDEVPNPAGALAGTGSCARPGSCEPSKLGETLGKVIGWLSGNGPAPY